MPSIPAARAALALSSLLLTALAAPYAALSAEAAATPAPSPPGAWSLLSGSHSVTPTTEVSLARTPDGVLHALFASEDGPNRDVVVARVPANGTGISDQIVHTGFDTMSPHVVLSVTSTGLWATYAGTIVEPPGNPWSDGAVHSAFWMSSTGVWSVVTAPAQLNDPHGFEAEGIGAAALSDDTMVTATTFLNDVTWSAGLGGPVSSFTQSDCCVDHATVVTDGTSAAVAWQGNGGTADTTGTFARQIYPGLGATTFKAPHSSHDTGLNHAARKNDQPTAAIVRNDGSTWLAYKVGYPTVTGVGLWKAGSPAETIVPGSAKARSVALAVAPNGRMWVAWITDSWAIKAVRTSATGLKFGAVRTIARPGSVATPQSIFLEGSRSAAALVINSGSALWHTQVQPGLSVTAAPTKWRHGQAKRVVFTVKDAGASIAGAKVKAKGRSCTTSRAGTCAIRFPGLPRGSFTASVSKTSYAKASVRLTVT